MQNRINKSKVFLGMVITVVLAVTGFCGWLVSSDDSWRQSRFAAQTIRRRPAIFSKRAVLAPYTNAPIENLNNYPGNDLGARINQADQALGSGKGIIDVYGGGDFLTPAYPSENRLIRFHPSAIPYKSKTVGHYGRIIYPKDNTVILGVTSDAIIEEASDPDNGGRPPNYSLMIPYAQTIVPTGESTANIAKSKNIHFFDLHIRGVRANQPNDVGLSTISLGNGDDSSIQDCWFEGVSAYPIQVGATPGETVKNYARNNAILRNRIENALSQNIAIINADVVYIEENEVFNPGKAPFQVTGVSANGVLTTNEPHSFYTGGLIRLRDVSGFGEANWQFVRVTKLSATTFSITRENGTPVPFDGNPDGGFADAVNPFAAIIDVEPNGDPRETVKNIKIRSNLIDFEKSAGGYYGAIAFQITQADIPNGGSEISNNIIKGVTNGSGQLSYGIYVTSDATKDLVIDWNSITNAGQSGLAISGTNIKARNNTMVNIGGGGNPAVSAFNLKNSVVSKNSIILIAGGIPGSKDIVEEGTNYQNVWSANRFGTLYHGNNAAVTSSNYSYNTTNGGIIQNPYSNGNYFVGNSPD